MSFAFLHDQTPLSEPEFHIAGDIRKRTESIISGRREYIDRKELDPDIYLPKANWSLDNKYYDCFRQLVGGDRSIVENLRLFSQIFTGYQLIGLKQARNLPVPVGLPEGLDDSLAKISKRYDPWVARYARTANRLPDFLRVAPPCKFGEIGWKIGGKIVTYDTYVYLERMALMYESGILDPASDISIMDRKPLVIIEIGGGYGGLAYHIKKIVPQARYYIVDIPESLIFSATYLSILFKNERNIFIDHDTMEEDFEIFEPGFTFVPNYLFPELLKTGPECRLVINTLSMSEMSEGQVRTYCEGIRKLVGDEGLFFEQNSDLRKRGLLNAEDIIDDYFPVCHGVPGRYLQMCTQGSANLWSNKPITSKHLKNKRKKNYVWGIVSKLINTSVDRIKYSIIYPLVYKIRKLLPNS